jgi:hypothetical protein
VDAIARRWRSLLIGAVAGAAFIACAGGGGAPVGVSDKPSGGTRPRAIGDAGLADAAGIVPDGYKTSFTKMNRAKLVSRHATERFEADIYANELAVKALATRSREVPVGAIVVEEHHERQGDKRPGPVYLMEKKAKGFAPEHGDWRWVMIGSAGQLVGDGVVDQCAGCHDDSPMDGLFPIVE